MEEETVKSDVRNGLRNDVPLLQSMLTKLSLKREHSFSHPDKKVCKSVFYHPLESEEHITNGEDRKDSTVRSDGDEEQTSSETEYGKEVAKELKKLPEALTNLERKCFLPVSLSTETQASELSQQPSKSECLEDQRYLEDQRDLNQETIKEDHVAGAALSPNNQSQDTSAHTSYLSVSSNKPESSQVGFKHELLDEACCGPSNIFSMDTSRVLTHQTAVNLTSKTTRSASDPVKNKPKEERPLSAPSISNLWEYEDFANAMSMKSFNKAATSLGQEDTGMSTGDTEHDNPLTKTQRKGVKNKMKNLTQKLMEKLRDSSKSTQDSVGQEEQNLKSMEMEAEAPEIPPPPLPPKKGKYVSLDRRFTLKDFKLDLEPINLVEEILSGSEWLSYLPSKESPTSDQSMTNDVLQSEKDIQLNVPLPTPEQDQSEDIKDNQDSASDLQEDNVAKVNSDLDVKHVEQDANIFAIPKALLTSNAIKQMAGIDCESNKSEDIYDFVDMYIIPRNDFPLMKRKASDAPLDFSAVKSFELLDNSALKSRIRLSKKRHHRPPKKNKKVKTETLSAIFYKIPPVILNESCQRISTTS